MSLEHQQSSWCCSIWEVAALSGHYPMVNRASLCRWSALGHGPRRPQRRWWWMPWRAAGGRDLHQDSQSQKAAAESPGKHCSQARLHMSRRPSQYLSWCLHACGNAQWRTVGAAGGTTCGAWFVRMDKCY